MGPYRKSFVLILLAAVAALGIGLAHAADAPTALPVDAETTVAGVPIACTGIGQTRTETRWQAYPVRVEVSDANNTYLVGGVITIRGPKGQTVLNVSCDAPWILMKLPPGAYRVDGHIAGSAAKAKSAAFSAPAKGQMRLVLQFPDA